MSHINKNSEDYYFESYPGMLLDEDVLQDFLSSKLLLINIVITFLILSCS
ncbi:hypothetical protein [Clostridium perfringens]